MKPSRTFVLLSLAMLFLFIIGLSSVALLAQDSLPEGDYFENTAIVATNAALLSITPTPDCRLIDIACPGEPTLTTPEQISILMASAVGTEYYDLAHTVTAAVATMTANTAPYDPELYATRQQEYRELATAGGPATYVLFYAQETALVSAYQGTPTATPPPTNLPYNGTPCAFSWARQSLPQITQYAEIALHSFTPGFYNATVYVETYGEACGSNFGAMTTDFYITNPVDDLTDDERLGSLIIAAVHGLKDSLYEYSLPAPFGYLDITFTANGETCKLRAMFVEIERALEDGKTGAVLIETVYGN